MDVLRDGREREGELVAEGAVAARNARDPDRLFFTKHIFRDFWAREPTKSNVLRIHAAREEFGKEDLPAGDLPDLLIAVRW